MSALEFTSLMDLASTDTTDVKAVRSRLPSEGIYIVSMTEAGMKEAELDDPEATPRANLRFQGVIEYFEPLKAPDDSENVPDLVGKNFNQFATLWLDDVAQAIGLLKGQFYERAKLPTAGQPGGIEGVEGWIDGVVGQRIGVRIRHSKGENTRAYYDWLSPKELDKAGIAWEDLGRPAYNPDGSEMEDPLAK